MSTQKLLKVSLMLRMMCTILDVTVDIKSKSRGTSNWLHLHVLLSRACSYFQKFSSKKKWALGLYCWAIVYFECYTTEVTAFRPDEHYTKKTM